MSPGIRELLELHRASGPFAPAFPPASSSAFFPDALPSTPPRATPPPPYHALEPASALEERVRRLGGAPASFERWALSWLLHASLGCSGEKIGRQGSYPVWCNPTSGNLHTVEADLFVAGGELGGLHEYDSLGHGLCERIGASRDEQASDVLVALSLVYGRQIAKYGLRGVRYAWIDLGHAIEAVNIAASSLGWSLERARSASLEEALGWGSPALGPWDRWPGDLLRVRRGRRRPGRLANELVPRLSIRRERTTPTASASPRAPEIDFARAARWIRASTAALRPSALPAASNAMELALLQRTRRSASSFRGTTEVPREAFEAVLEALYRSRALEALLLVHRVEGLAPGAYSWRRGADLSSIVLGSVEETALGLHGYQEAAENHAFSITFGLRLEDEPSRDGLARYREAHVEAGCSAQRLYLAAQASALPATGIGALLEDELEALGPLGGWTPLYSFACGSRET